MKTFSYPIYITRPILPNLKEVIDKLHDIWKSQVLTNMGKQHQLLENELKKYLKTSHLTLFNNGTVALLTALKSLNLKGEVITTPFTFPATIHCLAWNNLTPVFCDIDPYTMNIDPDKIEKLITKKTSAILGVHTFGTPCDVVKIKKIADKYKLKVIYDAAHAFGTEIDKTGIGNFGNLTMFSFHATKLFHTIEGGALSFSDKSLKEKLYLLKNFGIKNEEEVLIPGINGKLNEIQAAMGLIILRHIKEERKKRAIITKTYYKYLRNIDGITLMPKLLSTRDSYQYFTVRINKKEFGKSRDYVYNKFKGYNIYSRKYFFPLCSNYPCYKYLPTAAKKHLPIANHVAEEILAMPFYGNLSIDQIEKICEILKSFKK